MKLPFFKPKKLEESIQQPKQEVVEGLAVLNGLMGNRFNQIKQEMQSVQDYQVAAALSSMYSKAVEDRKKIQLEVDRLRNFYLVDVILNQLTEDSLSPEVGTGKILAIKSNNKEVDSELQYLNERFNFDQLVLNIVPDIIAYGEYTLATKVNVSPKVNSKQESHLNESILDQLDSDDESTEYGLYDISDTVDQGSIVALTKFGTIDGYLVKTQKNKLEVKEPADFVKFTLGGHRVRIDLAKELNKNFDETLPRFVRVGKSIIHPLIPKLRELELLEAMIPATKLSKLSNGALIGVQVPPGYDIERAIEAAKRVEGILNKKVGVDSQRGELSIENIMTSAGRLKCVPVFGDKGSLNKMDYNSDEPDELLGSTETLRNIILSSAGIPPELVFGSTDGSSKGQILKKYARYLRKLKAVQKAISEGLKQLCYIHLANKGIKFVPDEVEIEFCNKLIEVDNLDKLEFMDTARAMLDSLREFVNKLASPEENPVVAKYINNKAYVEFLDKQLSVIGLSGLINKDLETGELLEVPTQELSDANPEDISSSEPAFEEPVPTEPELPPEQPEEPTTLESPEEEIENV